MVVVVTINKTCLEKKVTQLISNSELIAEGWWQRTWTERNKGFAESFITNVVFGLLNEACLLRKWIEEVWDSLKLFRFFWSFPTEFGILFENYVNWDFSSPGLLLHCNAFDQRKGNQKLPFLFIQQIYSWIYPGMFFSCHFHKSSPSPCLQSVAWRWLNSKEKLRNQVPAEQRWDQVKIFYLFP